MTHSDDAAAWEQRWHPLREEWVVVAAHRQNRPWQGERMAVPAADVPAYDESCYFCPGNLRVSGARNPEYQSVFVFDNDHPCVGADAPRHLETPPGIYRNAPATGLEYYGVLFTFRADDGGTLGLLWVREDGKWKIASYQPFNQ